MATHETPASMLKESLIECLEAARFCCNYQKTDEKWKRFKGNGCLGYPGGVLLFSIIDSIGSYFRKDNTIKIKLDGKDTIINGDGWEHLKILNSEYFNQDLPKDFIRALYQKFRSPLIHNSILGNNAVMIPNNKSIQNHKIQGKAFFALENKKDGSLAYMISLNELMDLCDAAVNKFRKDIDKIVPYSRQGKNFR